MQILSHRGLWSSVEEKNSLESFRREFDFCATLDSTLPAGGGRNRY